ncbi:SGNH/GDSL hydrolase family protein [Bradyrhizobium sp. HKCCYLS2038]|uniref:SGNH/GDSL hydrolase family protein n=1 Tax=Bradyrhizobium sp. HKCCYLS2038 TaxID=3420764 RepID=UPI003EBF6AE4
MSAAVKTAFLLACAILFAAWKVFIMPFYLSSNVVNVTLIGDSIIANMVPFKASMPAPFNNHQNLGLSGDTMAQIRARIASVSASATHLVIEGGTNDLVGLNTTAGIIPNYTTIINAFAPAMRVVVVGIPQVDEAALEIAHPGWSLYLNNQKIRDMNNSISELCRSITNCVPATSVMSRSMVGRAGDGIHPNGTESIERVRLLLPYLGL